MGSSASLRCQIARSLLKRDPRSELALRPWSRPSAACSEFAPREKYGWLGRCAFVSSSSIVGGLHGLKVQSGGADR
ncbi:hypothetical protein BJX65DRAFT_191604 [Aspergillus insuetus]